MTTPSYNIYTFIHKYLRQQLCRSLLAIGAIDDSDEQQVNAQLGELASLLKFCQAHLEHENRFIHGAIMTRNPHLYLTTEADHKEHENQIQKLLQDTQRIHQSAGARRSQLLHQLYTDLALFVAENLDHMYTEETHNAQVLADLFTESEIHHIHENIIAALSPEERMQITVDMLTTLMHSERLMLLREMQQHMPDPVFEGVIGKLAGKLPPLYFSKLRQALTNTPAPEPAPATA